MTVECRTIPGWQTPEGAPLHFYRLTNRRQAVVELCDWGARWTHAWLPDGTGRMQDVLQGYDSLDDLLADACYRGATVGRFANRIGRAEVTVDGVRYPLERNDGRNSNHGGFHGLNKRLWQGEMLPDGVRFSCVSPHLEGGWPGEVTVQVTYRWDDEDRLDITYDAVSSADTWLNLTNHAYFNLGGNPGNALEHRLYVPSSERLETDEEFIPSGRRLPVAGTLFDFSVPQPLSRYLVSDDPQFVWNRGYNHCFCLPGWNKADGTLRLAARLSAPDTGLEVAVYTDMPGLLVYSGGYLPAPSSAVALEAQYWPDAPAHPDFPSCLLRAGEKYGQRIRFCFGTATTGGKDCSGSVQ